MSVNESPITHEKPLVTDNSNTVISDYETLLGGVNDPMHLPQSKSKPEIKGDLFDAIFENIKIGIALQDDDGKICNANSALEHILGFTKQELRQKSLADLIHPDDNKFCGATIAQLATGKCGTLDIETRLTGKNGQIVWSRLIGSQIKTAAVKSYSIFLIDDITERKETEKIKDAFVDMVAHELKNPLMAMVSSLRLAKKEGQFPDVQRELISIASDGAESLWSMLENLLEVSRAKAGRLKLAAVTSKIEQLITEVIASIRQTLIHRLITEIPENLPPVVIDPARIHLVLRNLIDNAIKYSPKGGDILVFVKHTGDEIVVGVKDEGIGISENHLQDLFQPFERLGVTNTLGSGLGLAVCRILITYHNGRIWVESKVGKGSTFYFALPLSSK